MSNNSKDKKSSNNLFLFTTDGNKAIFEYVRNLTPQVFIFSIGVVFGVRALEQSFSAKALTLGIVSFAMCSVFIYLFITNIINFIDKSTEYMTEQLNEVDGYKVCKDRLVLKLWFKHLITTLKLIFKKKKSLFIEFFVTVLFAIIPSSAVFIATASTALSIYKSIFVG